MSWLETLAKSKPVSQAAAAGNGTRPIADHAKNGDRACDDFNERASWADILEPLGAVLHHETGGERYWTRPRKDPRDGYSATTDYADDADRLKVFTSHWPPFADGEVYDKFGAYALLNHGGDHKEAARELGRMGYGQQQDPGPRRPAHNGPPEMAPHPADQPHQTRTATAAHVQEEDQAEPDPPEPLPEIPTFPVVSLTGPLRAFVDWGTKDGLHPECTVVAGLAALVTLTGPARLRLSDVKTVKAILWTALVGVASSRETPPSATAQPDQPAVAALPLLVQADRTMRNSRGNVAMMRPGAWLRTGKTPGTLHRI